MGKCAFYCPSVQGFNQNSTGSRVRPEGGFKNRKLDLPKHISGSCNRNWNIFFDIPVPVNLEPEFQILVPVPA